MASQFIKSIFEYQSNCYNIIQFLPPPHPREDASIWLAISSLLLGIGLISMVRKVKVSMATILIPSTLIGIPLGLGVPLVVRSAYSLYLIKLSLLVFFRPGYMYFKTKCDWLVILFFNWADLSNIPWAGRVSCVQCRDNIVHLSESSCLAATWRQGQEREIAVRSEILRMFTLGCFMNIMIAAVWARKLLKPTLFCVFSLVALTLVCASFAIYDFVQLSANLTPRPGSVVGLLGSLGSAVVLKLHSLWNQVWLVLFLFCSELKLKFEVKIKIKFNDKVAKISFTIVTANILKS